MEKIIKSIQAASDDIGEPLNESDLHNIAKDIENEIKALGKEEVSFEIIRRVIVETLNKEGFKDVSRAYIGY
ncbi:ATP cone domain-containing protein [Caloramator sp. mosi_1]|uniref:ATP cone domain-containing protein n=1 Tax=Caloramator sp. mosi_1 TaxID=3023090 RepID=UPI003FCCB866